MAMKNGRGGRVSMLWVLASVGVAGLCVGGARADDHGHAAKDDAPAATKAHDAPKPKSAGKSNPFKTERPATKPTAKADEQHGEPSREMKPASSPAVAHDHDAQPALAPAQPAPEPAHTTNAHASLGESGSISADEALTLLKEGNQRWVLGQTIHPAVDSARREALAKDGQRPFATVLTCADSRIPVERVFDRGVGEVFAIRVAGNVSGPSETGTIEYGLGHLHTKLLVVMGHTKCGAVAAAASGAELHGAVGGLVASIEPAVDRAKREHPGAEGEELLASAIRQNVWQSVFGLIKSDEIRGLVSSGDVKIVGAIYDVGSGTIEWLGEHPWQRELIAAMDQRNQSRAIASEPAKHAPESDTTHAVQPE